MSYGARVFRVLIASPSDVNDEREIAVATIQAWNDLNSSERQIVLLPLRWETHTAPEYGRRPQEVINRQIVDHCDLLVGIFWTRIGSPTGAADSGTLEEIERVAKQGKPVMLYFSQAKQDPDRIELDQLRKLRDFKSKTFPKALIEQYSDQIEFRNKLSKQLEMKLRELLAEENQIDGNKLSFTPRTEIQFGFADPKTGKLIGQKLDVHTNVIQLEELDKIPDFAAEAANGESSDTSNMLGVEDLWGRDNKDYYREMAAYLVRESFFRPIRFWLKNVGGVGARDLYVDVRISSDTSDFTVVPLDQAALSPPQPSGKLLLWRGFHYPYYKDADSEREIEELGSQRTTQFELPALQPQREISPKSRIAVGAKKSGVIEITARIYADSLPEPALQTLQINWTVKEIRKSAVQTLKEAGVEVAPQVRRPRAVK